MKRLLVAAALVLALPASAAAPRLLATEDAWPVWSPDGHTIAFTRVHPGRNLMELELVDVRTGRVRKVAQNGWQLKPSWSPDGASIAFQAGGDVWVAALDGTKRRVGKGGQPAYGQALARVVAGDLVVDGTVWARQVIGQPAWSPDGTRIAFRRDDGVYTAAGPGGGAQLAGGADPGDPVWSPDGSRVAFTLAEDEVWVASRGLVPAHAIARARPGASTPSWLADGSAVVYSFRGGVEQTDLGGHSRTLHRSAGFGASAGAGGIAWAAPRTTCPGHLGIAVGERLLTGSCAVTGTGRADVIEGTQSSGDVILAGAGDDRVHADDGHRDRVDCGPGHDVVWADRRDRLVHCEVVHR